MSKKSRKYALPYNGTNPAWYVDEVMKRKKNIDHVYCELPLASLSSHVRFMYSNAGTDYEMAKERFQYLENCKSFLSLSYGKFRRVSPINAMYYYFKNKEDFLRFANEVYKTVDEFKLDGLILSDYRLAEFFHVVMPSLEIQTSCNGYQWNITQMEIWKEKIGAKIFNPPREILRVPSKLKEMHEMGFKLKCLVNEGCLVGCPNSFNHQLSVSLGCCGTLNGCCQRGIGDVLRGNFILPRWQKFYDEFVDIYKIAGRNTKGNYPFFCMDAYLNENDSLPLTDLMISGVVKQFSKLPKEYTDKLTLNRIPDRLLQCECKKCSSCHTCDNLMQKYVPNKYVSFFNSNPFVLKGN